MELIIVIAIVLVAAALLLRLIIKQAKGESDCCSCGKSSECSKFLKEKKNK